jgi:hypothetical protein
MKIVHDDNRITHGGKVGVSSSVSCTNMSTSSSSLPDIGSFPDIGERCTKSRDEEVTKRTMCFGFLSQFGEVLEWSELNTWMPQVLTTS